MRTPPLSHQSDIVIAGLAGGAIAAARAAYSVAKAMAAAVRRRLSTRFSLLPNQTPQP